MHMEFDELWMDALDMRVSEQIVNYLKDYHQEYRDTSRRQWELLEKYPVLDEVLDGDETVTLNADEHRAFKEYLANRDDMERLEREYYYYYGQSHVFSYGRMLKSLNREISPDGAVARKKRLMDMLIEARTSDAELEYLKTDEQYKQRRKTALEQEELLKALNPSKEIMDQVDQLTSSINDYWSRYSDLIYQYALQDILAFLIER